MSRFAPLALVVALLLSLSVGAPPLRADDAVTVRYTLGPQDEMIYRSTTALEQEQTVNEQKVETRVETSEVSVRTLEKIDDDGRLHVQSENKRLKVMVQIGTVGKYEFDSTAIERDKASLLGAALTPLYERLAGAYLWATIDTRGEVVETRGYADLVKEIVKENPIASQFAAGGSEEGYRAALAQLYVTFPKEAIEPGDDWSTDIELKLPKIGDIVGKTTYKFAKLTMVDGHRIAEFDVAIDLAADLDIEQNGATVTGRLQSEKAGGKMRFDVTAGRMLSRIESYTISGTLNVAVAGQNLTIPMKQTQKVHVELLDKLPE